MIEAVQFQPERWREIQEWSGDKVKPIGNWKHKHDVLCMTIRMLDGTMIAGIGDWIIKDSVGEFSCCGEDVFAVLYEAVIPYHEHPAMTYRS